LTIFVANLINITLNIILASIPSKSGIDPIILATLDLLTGFVYYMS
jgi:hypothetical protein